MNINVALTLLFVAFCAFGRGIAQQMQQQQIDISNGDTINMKSPNFPRPYGNNFRYQLTISATPGARVVFDSRAFFLELGSSACPYDYLSINEQRFCGTNGPQNYVLALNSGSTVTVRFITDTSVTFSGFHITFRQELPVTLPPTPPPTNPPFTDPSNSRCGVPAVTPNVNDRIVGGITAVPHSWPWQIYFLVKTPQGNPQSFCGGSLINGGWVLTAAHCCFNLTASRISIILGAHNLNEAEPEWVRRSVSDVKVHPDYNPRSSSNDFCLVKLNEGVTRTTAIIPACIPDVADPPAGTKCYATGWGSQSAVRIQQPLQSEDFSNEISVRSNRKKRQSSNVLKQVDVRIIDQNICAVQYLGENPIEQNMICAANPGKDSCQGDSGGPLVCQIPGSSRYVLFGVASFGKGCAQPNYPGVYGRVSQVIPWIRSVAGSNDI